MTNTTNLLRWIMFGQSNTCGGFPTLSLAQPLYLSLDPFPLYRLKLSVALEPFPISKLNYFVNFR